MASCAVTQNVSQILTCDADQFTPYVFDPGTQMAFKIRSLTIIPVCVTGICLNLVVSMGMATHRRMRDLSLSKFLLTLTTVDFMISVTALPVYIHYNILLSEGRFCCMVGNILLSTASSLTMMSITSIVFINIQLYLAILKPFIYTRKFNKNFTFPILVCINIFWALSSITALFIIPTWWSTFRTSASGFGFLCYILISLLHYFICKESRNIRERSKSNSTLSCNKITRKTLRLTTSVLISFGLCYLPYIVMSVYTIIVPITPEFNTYFDTWAEYIAMMTCVLNPILYCIRLGSVRRSVLRLFGCGRVMNLRSFSMNTFSVKETGPNNTTT